MARKPTPAIVAALVHARQHGGGRASGKEAWDAFKLGLMEHVGDAYELNLRGQDIADEAIELLPKSMRQ